LIKIKVYLNKSFIKKVQRYQIRKLQEKEILVKKSRTEKAIKLPIF